MISGASEQELELANARVNIIMALDNTSTYESWLIIDTYIEKLEKENQELKRQLEYLRSGEYLNQLKFERNMLEDIVQNGGVSKEDKEFIDMTHRNTELLEENQALKEKIRGKQNSIKALKDALKERTEERDNHYDKEYLYKSVIKRLRGTLNNIILDELPFDIAEQVQDLFDEVLGGDVDDE